MDSNRVAEYIVQLLCVAEDVTQHLKQLAITLVTIKPSHCTLLVQSTLRREIASHPTSTLTSDYFGTSSSPQWAIQVKWAWVFHVFVENYGTASFEMTSNGLSNCLFSPRRAGKKAGKPILICAYASVDIVIMHQLG